MGSPRGGVVAKGTNARNSFFKAVSSDLAHAVHRHGLVLHFVLPELDLPPPYLGLASGGEQDVDFIEAELPIEQQRIFLLRPAPARPPVLEEGMVVVGVVRRLWLLKDEAGCIGRWRRQGSWLE